MLTKNAVLALLLLASFSGCASSGTSSAAPGTRPQPSGSRGPITVAEMRETTPGGDVLQLVQRLRPNWLWLRSGGGRDDRGTIQVYENGLRIGNLEVLRGISADAIASIHFLSGIEATQRFGTDHGGGVLVVTTRAGIGSAMVNGVS